MVDSYTAENAGASPEMQQHIAGRLQAMRATAERLSKVKRDSVTLTISSQSLAALNSAISGGGGIGSGGGGSGKKQKRRVSKISSPAGASSASRTAFDNRLANLDAEQSASSSSASVSSAGGAPLDGETFIARVASSPVSSSSSSSSLKVSPLRHSVRPVDSSDEPKRASLSKSFSHTELSDSIPPPPPPLPEDSPQRATGTPPPPPLPVDTPPLPPG